MTVTVGDKGSSHPHVCMDNNDGTNVLSVLFQPEHQTLVRNLRQHFSDEHLHYVCSILHGRRHLEKAGDLLCM